jgi:Zinc knuckle
MQGHKSTEFQARKQSLNQASSGNTPGAKTFTGNCFRCGKPGHISKNCRVKVRNQTASNNGLFVGEIEDCINSLTEVRAHKDWSLESDSTMSDEDRKLTPRELQALMNSDPEVEENQSGSNGDLDHEEETAIAPS